MSSSSQSNDEAQNSRQTPQQASRAESRSSSRSALNHSNARRHRASRGAPYAPPLRGSQANPDRTQGLADGPARPGHAQESPDHVRMQSNEFKQDYLPAGYMDRDPAAVASVNSELRDRLKHERGAMRNLLLSMVHSPLGEPLTHPVPTLTNLIIDMQSRMLPNSEGDLHTDTRVRARIAYLRIQTICHYARWVPGDINRQWALIDKQLQELRGRFFKLILELDSSSFRDQFFSWLDVENIRPPTDLEVMAKMAIIAEENATQPLPTASTGSH
ncbi:hypothetical protein PtA15_17A106 [Puccinia triticina]|uniref:Uncharacterized protein n=1 Tax=Puccinia triticina TaxID=208348 RepID=A0ABY7D4S9_9BASI|nr:uncharacterized protein PtA15_17A106 [Puccinia triticina]WAQ92624.1 hypothetical protein PtA15_17A106 [Puccinia triticina]